MQAFMDMAKAERKEERRRVLSGIKSEVAIAKAHLRVGLIMKPEFIPCHQLAAVPRNNPPVSAGK